MEFLGYMQRLPLLISSMTSGTDQTERINRDLAIAAEHFDIALALGSGRVAISHPEPLSHFRFVNKRQTCYCYYLPTLVRYN